MADDWAARLIKQSRQSTGCTLTPAESIAYAKRVTAESEARNARLEAERNANAERQRRWRERERRRDTEQD